MASSPVGAEAERTPLIRRWPFRHIAELFDEVARIWHWGYGLGELKPCERGMVRAEDGRRYLRLATGGWSGNEDVIDAMQGNIFVRHCWRVSACGGLHIYEYPRKDQG